MIKHTNKKENITISNSEQGSYLCNENIKHIVLPENVEFILNKLHNNGFEAYIVGGCVRDSILGVNPSDWDITTSALPNDIKNIFEKTVDTGLKHGTITVMMDKEPYEITTYRIDGEYEDNRHPKQVQFTSNLVEDLKRRDFTINAMAYNKDDGIVDVFNGINDLKNKLIRCVGNPNNRFEEDALRMLRAIRFGAALGFEIDRDTEDAIKSNANLIQNVSGERIHIELTKTLVSKNPQHMEKLYTLGLMKYIIPEFEPCVSLKQNNPYHVYDVDKHIYVSVCSIEATESLRWTMYLHDIGKGYTKTTDKDNIDHFYGHEKYSVKFANDILNRLKFDNKTKNIVLKLIEMHDYRIKDDIKAVRKALNKIGDELFEDYIKVQKADIKAQNPKLLEDRIVKLNNILSLYKQIKDEQQCTSIKDLMIKGTDLIEIGFKQGIIIGETLNKLLEYVIEEPNNNTKEWLINKALEIKN